MAVNGFDDMTRQARARLIYEHARAMIQVTTNPDRVGTLGSAVKMAKALASLDLDQDPEYDGELKEIREAFQEDKRPKSTSPDQWLRERRIEEYEAILRSISRQGCWKGFELSWDKEPL